MWGKWNVEKLCFRVGWGKGSPENAVRVGAACIHVLAHGLGQVRLVVGFGQLFGSSDGTP